MDTVFERKTINIYLFLLFVTFLSPNRIQKSYVSTIGLDLVQLAIQYSLRTLFSPKVPEALPTTSIFLSRTIRLKAINKGGNLLGQ